jgi:hypothetical protein
MKKQCAVFFLLMVLLQGCSSVQPTPSAEQKALRVRDKVEAFNFTFEALTAQSMRFNLVHLSPDYTLKVSKDTLKAYLPYFGQAYTAPLNSTEGGIKFTSTKFERKVVLGKHVGNWKITFKTLDTPEPLNLYLEIWGNGSAHLNVNDPNRQSISFDGELVF